MSSPQRDPSQNILARISGDLDPFFAPRSVALVGAKDTPGSVGGTLLRNLRHGFTGELILINPKRERIGDLPCYPSIAEAPSPIDLAIVATPAHTVPGVMEELGQAGIPAAIVISAGFREGGPEGIAREEALLRTARRHGIRVLGPNCLGLMCPRTGLNASFAQQMARPGRMAFLSQSGAMCTAVLDWAAQHALGFSAFVSIGEMADVSWGDLIDYFGHDPETDSILLYMESVGDPRTFLSAAREVALAKPVIVIKGGRTQAAASAAASHTGALTGSDEVFDAACHRTGVLRVNTISELFQTALVLSQQPSPPGPRLAIVSNAGGPAVLATDAAVLGGATMAPLSSELLEQLDRSLPSCWSHANPVDILGDAHADRYAAACSAVYRDADNDGLLVILTPQDMTEPAESAEQLIQAVDCDGSKPVLASWMGGASVESGRQVLQRGGIPCFAYPDAAASCFAQLWSYRKSLAALQATSVVSAPGVGLGAARAKAHAILQSVREQGRVLLDEFESKQLLEAYGIPTVQTQIARSAEEAAEAALAIGFPVVVKLYSRTITHKAAMRGVRLNLQDATAVVHAFEQMRAHIVEVAGASAFDGVTVQPMIPVEGVELIIGSSIDPQFGPVVLFGTGGSLTEVYRDRALALPPLSRPLAAELIDRTLIASALRGDRGGHLAVPMDDLVHLVLQFSTMITENPEIVEFDINPLRISAQRMVVLDARAVLLPPGTQPTRLAIRPYPTEYVSRYQLPSGITAVIRPVMPEDEGLLNSFREVLSTNQARLPFLSFLSLDPDVIRERITRVCHTDYERGWTLLVLIPEGDGNGEQCIAVARLLRHAGHRGIFRVVILDAWQHQGLGSYLLEQMIAMGRKEGMRCLEAYVGSENDAMCKLLEHFGFHLNRAEETILATLSLEGEGRT